MRNFWYIFPILVLGLLISCSQQKSPVEIKTHPAGWYSKDTGGTHGKYVVENGAESCRSCHGKDYSGGEAEISCYTCHPFPHPEEFEEPGSANFHGKFIASQLRWNLSVCQQCHGVDYAGGKVGESCLECHTLPGGPEACNTCHGNSNNPAPPKDLRGNTERSAIGVGAHQKHVAETTITTLLGCQSCHPPLTGFDDPAHINNPITPEIQFCELATDSSWLNPVWDSTTATCSQVYCHGAFKFRKDESANQYAYVDSVITGVSAPVFWTEEPSGEACALCHALPPAGHLGEGLFTTPQSCSGCHTAVVNPDGSIKDPSLHINGKADLN